jgi:YD repeat-containing protein
MVSAMRKESEMTRARRDPRVALAFAMVFVLAPWASPAPAAESYTYDTQSRLTDITYQNGGSLHYTYDANGNITSEIVSLATAVEEGAKTYQFALGPTTPNPGGGARNVSFTLAARGHVVMRVFDVAGRLHATLVDHDLNMGPHVVRFSTDRWSAGVYYYRLEWAGKSRSGRMIVLR